MRRILYIIIVVAVIALVVLFFYLFRYRAPAPLDVGGGNGGGLPTDTGAFPFGATGGSAEAGRADDTQAPLIGAGQKFGLGARHDVLDYFVSPDAGITLIKPDGQILRMTGEEESVLSGTSIADIISARFSEDGAKVLVTFGSRNNLQHSLFDVKKGEWTEVDSRYENPVWAPAGHRIAYTRRDSQGKTLLEIIDADKPALKARSVIALFAEDLRITWVTPAAMLLSSPPSAFAPSGLWRVDINKKTITRVLPDRAGLMHAWNPDGTRGLVFGGTRTQRKDLSLVGAFGATLHNMSILTFPQKCAFSSEAADSGNATSTGSAPTTTKTAEALYCAVPQGSVAFNLGILPDDYLKNIVFTLDAFYKINLTSGDVSPVFQDAAQRLDAVNIKSANGRLYFINRYDNKLYAVSLESK